MSDSLRLLFGKRKFTVAVMALMMSFVLALIGVVDAENWRWCVAAIVGLYAAFEAGEGAAHAAFNDKGRG